MESRTIQIEQASFVDVNVRPDVAVVYCPDPRVRSCHKRLIRDGMGLGKRDEEYVLLPILGGAAVLAHPQHFVSEFSLIRASLGVMREHFGVSRLVLIGHEDCKHMGAFHLKNNGDSNPSRVLEDMRTVLKMFQERSSSSECPVRRMFAEFEFEINPRIVYMKFPTANELEYIEIA